MQALYAAAFLLAVLGAEGSFLVRDTEDATCLEQDHAHRSLIQEKLATFGVNCESMCKEMGAYPDCMCPGFAGQPAEADDMRGCIAKNCQDPNSPCPNDAFMTCVHETTKVSVLQWDALLQSVDANIGAYRKTLVALKGKGAAAKRASTSTSSCKLQDRSHRALIQQKLAVLGVQCEKMCKEMGSYPDCQCPGFKGQPADDGDTRACMDQYCQDPAHPCPTDAFMTCVSTTTKVSVLQWDSLFQKLDADMGAFKRTVVAAKAKKAQAKKSVH